MLKQVPIDAAFVAREQVLERAEEVRTAIR
jgi:hypothetical protein